MAETDEERRKRAEAHLETARQKESAGDSEGAIAELTSAIHSDSRWARARVERGRLRHRLQRIEQAIDDFNEAIRVDPDYARAFAERGLCHLERRDYNAAENDFSKALASAPTHRGLRAKRVEARLALNRGWPALEDANALVEATPDDPEGYYWRGLALEAVDDKPGAEQNLREALRRGHAQAKVILNKRYGGA